MSQARWTESTREGSGVGPQKPGGWPGEDTQGMFAGWWLNGLDGWVSGGMKGWKNGWVNDWKDWWVSICMGEWMVNDMRDGWADGCVD